jgi:hypothetical protein
MKTVDLGGFAMSALVTGDFNGDGRADLALAGSDPTSGQNEEVEVFLGQVDGTFQAMTPIDLGGLNPFTLVTGDFNGDGRADLALAGYDSASGRNEVEVLLGRGDGTFQVMTPIDLGSLNPSTMVTGDFNGDGWADLAVVGFDRSSGHSDGEVLLGRGDGTFQAMVADTLSDLDQFTVVAGDFNGDGSTDLASADPGGLLVEINQGNGRFGAPGAVGGTNRNTPIVADPGDGTDDVFIVNQDGNILWRKGDPAAPGSYSPPITINPGFPSRDLTFVATRQGPVLASVDLGDDAVSLYADRNGQFVRIGSLATGTLPTQIASADLNGDGIGDLVVYDAGDGAAAVYLGNGIGGFARQADVPLGLGVSNIALADVDGTGHPDLVVTNQVSDLVTVVPGNGGGTFGTPSSYPAGRGPYALNASTNGTTSVTSNEDTAGVAIGTFTRNEVPSLATIDPGTDSFAVLTGLSGGTFANPVQYLTSTPGTVVRSGDFTGDGLDDLALLGPDGVTIALNDGTGKLHPIATYNVGPDPTGLTLADVNHDGKLDLLVGNSSGDILLLLGNGDGTFRPSRRVDQNVAIAVAPTGGSTPEFIFADQGLDRVVTATGSQSTVLANRASGIIDPAAVTLADLNGDGIPDLIVVNSGGDNVLVYPGLGNGQFGPELNGGKGFFTGTDPVSVTVADVGNGRLDLVVANQGSNDVAILLNQQTASGAGFTFTNGPRLKAGLGPTSTVVEYSNGFPNILASDGGSNLVTMIPGVGNGFFNDQNSRTFPVGSDPGQILVGNFLPGQGTEILTVNRGSNDVTVISDFTSSTFRIDTFSTGGEEPVAAFAVRLAGQALESLVVANSGDGLFTLLGGTEGLELEQTLSNPALSEPSALALAALTGSEVSFYATTAGMEAAFTLAFILPGFPASVSSGPASSSATIETPTALVALSETSLALVGSLLVTVLNPTPAAPVPAAAGNGNENQAEASTAFLSVAPSQGQSLFTEFSTAESESGGEVAQTELEPPRGQAAPPWSRYVLGLDERFETIRQQSQDALFGKDKDQDQGQNQDKGTPDGPGAALRDDPGDSSDLRVPSAPAAQPTEPTLRRKQDNPRTAEAVDAAIKALVSGVPLRELPIALRFKEPAVAVPQAGPLPDHPDPARAGEPVPVWVSLAVATTMTVRANPPGCRAGMARTCRGSENEENH